MKCINVNNLIKLLKYANRIQRQSETLRDNERHIEPNSDKQTANYKKQETKSNEKHKKLDKNYAPHSYSGYPRK